MDFIARYKEMRKLKSYLKNQDRDLVALYGRRGSGKTRILKEFFDLIETEGRMFITARADLEKKEQIKQVVQSTRKVFKNFPLPKDWNEYFFTLAEVIQQREGETKERFFLFVDEFSWFDKKKEFLRAFAAFYEELMRNNILVIISSSITSWMQKYVFEDKGTLFHKVKEGIKISAFSYVDTVRWLRRLDPNMSFNDILDYYFATGGVARYLSKINLANDKRTNLSKIFSQIGENDFEKLLISTFESTKKLHYLVMQAFVEQNTQSFSEIYERVERLNIDKFKVSRAEVKNALNELCISDLLGKTSKYGNKKKEEVYFVRDLFCYFNLKDPDPARGLLHNQVLRGFAFELVARNNADLIKEALGRSGVETKEFSWRTTKEFEERLRKKYGDVRGAQIDLILKWGREKDKEFTLVECKYHEDKEHVISSDELKNVKNKEYRFEDMLEFVKHWKNYRLNWVYFTPYGVKNLPNNAEQVILEEITKQL